MLTLLLVLIEYSVVPYNMSWISIQRIANVSIDKMNNIRSLYIVS